MDSVTKVGNKPVKKIFICQCFKDNRSLAVGSTNYTSSCIYSLHSLTDCLATVLVRPQKLFYMFMRRKLLTSMQTMSIGHSDHKVCSSRK